MGFLVNWMFFLFFKDKLVFEHKGTDNDKKYFYVHPETGAVSQIGDLTDLPEKVQTTIFQACVVFDSTNCLYL